MHIGVPVRVGGLVVNQTDLLHGDANGITSIPSDIASEIADLADEFVGAEDIVMDYVKSDGSKNVKEFNERFQQFQAVKKNLIKRVSRRER